MRLVSENSTKDEKLINLEDTQIAYDDTIKKLKSGKGNIIGRVEKLSKLGAKTKKIMPPSFTQEELPE